MNICLSKQLGETMVAIVVHGLGSGLKSRGLGNMAQDLISCGLGLKT